MRDLREYVRYYVARLAGSDAEDAWHALVEAGPDAVPFVEDAFATVESPDVKVALLQVVSQWRSADATRFLSHQLGDPAADIWKAALDGLVATGGPTVLDLLRSTRARTASERAEWIDEAIRQITDQAAR